MRNKVLDKIKKSSSPYVSVLQACEVLGFAYISIINRIRNGKDVGFAYEYKSDKECLIPKKEFIEAIESWKWTADNIKLLKDNFISVDIASNAIGCAKRTLRKDIKDGKDLGFNYYQIGGIWRIHKKSFLEFIEGGKRNDGEGSK